MVKVRSEDIDTGAANGRVVGSGTILPRHLHPDTLRRLLDGQIGARIRLGSGAVGAPNLSDGSVTPPKLQDGSVTEPAIRPGSVTGPKIADGSVTGPKVPAGALGARELADGSLTPPKFASGSRPVQIVDGLPDSPLGDGFLPGDAIVDMSGDDAKIYRLKTDPAGWDRWDDYGTWDASGDWPSGVWTAEVDTFDLRGLLDEGNFGDDLITARMVAANQIGATELAAVYVEVDKWIRSYNWSPGSAGWAIDGDGYFELAGGVIRGNTQIGGVVTDEIRSTNYEAGVSGWAVGGSNAEFNDVTIRGGVAVGDGIVSGNYSPGSSGWAISEANAELNDATFRGNIEAASVTAGQLVSSNYSAGSDGWALDASGNAELNDATFRGSILASTITGSTLETSLSQGRRAVFGDDGFIRWNDSGGSLLARMGFGSTQFSSDVLFFESNSVMGIEFNDATSFHNTVNVNDSLFVTGTVTVDEGEVFLSSSGSSGLRVERVGTDSFRVYHGNDMLLNLAGQSAFGAPGITNDTSSADPNVYVTSNGSVRRSTADISTRATKADITPLGAGEADAAVVALEPVRFRSLLGDLPEDHFELGLVAEDVAEVDSRLVRYETGEDGEQVPAGVRYQRLGMHLLPVVQGLMARVEDLEGRLEAAGV